MCPLGTQTDLLSRLVTEKDPETNEKLDRDVVRDQILMHLSNGFNGPSLILSWLCHMMAIHPEVTVLLFSSPHLLSRPFSFFLSLFMFLLFFFLLLPSLPFFRSCPSFDDLLFLFPSVYFSRAISHLLPFSFFRLKRRFSPRLMASLAETPNTTCNT